MDISNNRNKISLKFLNKFLFLLALCAFLSGCGKTMRHIAIGVGVTPKELTAKDFVVQSRKGNIDYIPIENSRKPKIAKMTAESAERDKSELDRLRLNNEQRGQDLQQEAEKAFKE